MIGTSLVPALRFDRQCCKLHSIESDWPGPQQTAAILVEPSRTCSKTVDSWICTLIPRLLGFGDDLTVAEKHPNIEQMKNLAGS